MKPRLPAFRVPVDAPISTINTTPLIDVMLVLLIMFILSVPPTTDSVRIDLPSDRPVEVAPPTLTLELDAAGRLAWRGAPIAEGEIPVRAAAFLRARPDAILLLRADAEARYEDFDRVLALLERSGIERLAFPDNHLHTGALDG